MACLQGGGLGTEEKGLWEECGNLSEEGGLQEGTRHMEGPGPTFCPQFCPESPLLYLLGHNLDWLRFCFPDLPSFEGPHDRQHGWGAEDSWGLWRETQVAGGGSWGSLGGGEASELAQGCPSKIGRSWSGGGICFLLLRVLECHFVLGSLGTKK